MGIKLRVGHLRELHSHFGQMHDHIGRMHQHIGDVLEEFDRSKSESALDAGTPDGAGLPSDADLQHTDRGSTSSLVQKNPAMDGKRMKTMAEAFPGFDRLANR